MGALLSLPHGAAEMRQLLGERFTEELAGRIQNALGIHVIVTDIVGDGYTMHVAGQHVIVVKRTATWARQNFSLAHELGHIVAETVAERPSCGGGSEAAANAFAADLLMPADHLRSLDWQHLRPAEVAQLVWDLGVSTTAVQVRLTSLGLEPSPDVRNLLALNTFSLLRRHWAERHDSPDRITERRERSAARLFPLDLASRLETKVLAGLAPAESLAYLLGVSPDEIGLTATPPNRLDDDLAILRELTDE